MRRHTTLAVVLAACLLVALPAMATAASAQAVQDDAPTQEHSDANTETDLNATDPFSFDAVLNNETVTVSVSSNETAVENATVAVNSTTVGTTDENGTLAFGLDNRTAVDISVTVEETQTTTYEVVDGELVAEDASEGPPEEMPDEAADQVSTIHKLITAFQNGEYDQLGPIVSEAAGGGPPADVGNGSDNAPDHAGNGSENVPDHAGNGSGNAPDHAGNGSGNAPAHAGNGSGNAPAHAGNGSGNAPDHAGNTDYAGNGGSDNADHAGNSGSGNGNGGPGAANGGSDTANGGSP